MADGEETDGGLRGPGGESPPALPARKRKWLPASVPGRVLLILLTLALVFAAMVAVGYALENVYGRHVWEVCQRELAAQGESLDPAHFIPESVPDERNVAMAPLFARTWDYRVDPATRLLTFGPHKNGDTPFTPMPYGGAGKKPEGVLRTWMSGHALPLDRLQRYYAEQPDFPHPAQPGTPSDDVLLALTRFGPTLAEAADALDARPEARFPVNWTQLPPWSIRMPHHAMIQKLAGVLRLRAVANLAAGRHAEAARDVAMGFRLRATFHLEPTLLSHLYVVTVDNLVLQPVWEGLAARRWTAEELLAIQQGLRADDLLADYPQALRGERAIFFCRTLDDLRQKGDTRRLFTMGEDSNDQSLDRYVLPAMVLLPRGWIDISEASVCRGYQQLLNEVVDLKRRRVSTDRLRANEDQRARWSKVLSPWTFLPKVILPVCESTLVKSVRTQTGCEQAETACALERYFLANQRYPETLDALVPAFLDRVSTDLMDGAPMRYRRTEDGRYRLYNVGQNGRDDGGTVGWNWSSSDEPKQDDKRGDLVWQYTPVEPPAPL